MRRRSSQTSCCRSPSSDSSQTSPMLHTVSPAIVHTHRATLYVYTRYADVLLRNEAVVEWSIHVCPSHSEQSRAVSLPGECSDSVEVRNLSHTRLRPTLFLRLPGEHSKPEAGRGGRNRCMHHLAFYNHYNAPEYLSNDPSAKACPLGLQEAHVNSFSPSSFE